MQQMSNTHYAAMKNANQMTTAHPQQFTQIKQSQLQANQQRQPHPDVFIKKSGQNTTLNSSQLGQHPQQQQQFP